MQYCLRHRLSYIRPQSPRSDKDIAPPHTHRTIMWVRAYIAQLSAARAKPHRNRVCGPGHYGNSRAPGKQQVLSTLGKVVATRGRGAASPLQKAPEVPTPWLTCDGTVSVCGQPCAAAGLPLVTSIQGLDLLCHGSACVSPSGS